MRGRFRTQNSNYIEYIASCLTEDLEPENNYNLLISVGTIPSGPDFEVDVIVLGVNHCDFPLPGTVCIEDDFPEIGRQYISLEYGEWKNISIPIVLNESYSSVIIGLSCTSDFEASEADFLFDDVCLIKELTSANSNTIEENNFQLYPNPSNGLLNIKSNPNFDYSVILFDMVGSQILAINNATQIKLNQVPNGVYILELKNNQTKDIRLEKIIVQK